MSMRFRWLAGCVLITVAFLLSCGSSSNKGFIYLVSQGSQSVNAISLDLHSGELNSSNSALVTTGDAAATGVQPTALILNPTQTLGFVANTGSNDITVLNIAKDGKVSAVGNTPLNAPAARPVALAMDPSGKFLFVADQGDSTQFSNCTPRDPAYPANCTARISVFTVGGSGGLSEVDGSPFPLLTASQGFSFPSPVSLTALTVANQGNYLYVTEQNNNIVVGFAFDPSSGVLTQLTSTPVVVGIVPSGITSPATGDFLYVANATSNNITGFSIDSTTGILTTIPGSPFSTGVSPISFATLVASDHNYVYTVNNQSSQVSGFSMNAVTGDLKPLTPPNVSTGSLPVAATIRSDGEVAGDFWMIVSDTGINSVSTFKLTTSTGSLNALPQLVSPVDPYGIASK